MPNKPTIGIRLDPTDPDYADLLDLARRVAKLLKVAENSKDYDLGNALDLLLGAVYALIQAKHEGYKHRTGPTQPDKVMKRALDLASGWVRTDGKWTAGFHFNSGRLRIAAVYHRVLKIAAGIPHERKKDKVRDLRKKLKATFPKWDDSLAYKIYDDVNRVKHVPKHDAHGREVEFDHATKASIEILVLIELWSAQNGHL